MNDTPLDVNRIGTAPVSRRLLVRLGLLVGLGGGVSLLGQPSSRPPEKLRPQAGDRLVHAYGERKHELITLDQVEPNAAPLFAFPMDPDSRVVRDGSRLNQVLVVRLARDLLSEPTAAYAGDEFVAYSAVCTHTGCDVTQWRPETHHLVCPCHGSEFDATDAAKVSIGPAPKPLALLGLEVKADELRVNRGFSRRVGFQPL